MYLEHFKLSELPFTLTPNIDFYCNLDGHRAALNVLVLSLRNGEGFIKVVGEVGTGKTMLCRMLLEELDADQNFVTAYIPNPDLSPVGLRKAIAQELGIEFEHGIDHHALLGLINQRLLTLFAEKKSVVIIIDEAQALPAESLEGLRLLTNLETRTTKLLQVVLLGQPELDSRLEHPQLRQLKQRITFSYRLSHLTRKELETYIFHRLAKAGHTMALLFNRKACDELYRYSKGIPRIINILSHKSLMVAYGRGETTVGPTAVKLAVNDTEYMQKTVKSRKRAVFIGIAVLVITALALLLFFKLKI